MMEIELKKLSPQDIDAFAELIKIFADIFEMANFKIPDSAYLKRLLDNPDFFVLIAECNGKVIGGLTVYVLHTYYAEKPVAYVYDVGVLTGYQRNGIGKKLIAYLTQYCKEKGFEYAYVEAETDDIRAISFYRATPISDELLATHFTYTFGSGGEYANNNPKRD